MADEKIKKDAAYRGRVFNTICRDIGKVDNLCWGYENGCDRLYHEPQCPESSQGWSKSKMEQKKTFFNQADFGYIKERRSEMDFICRPHPPPLSDDQAHDIHK